MVRRKDILVAVALAALPPVRALADDGVTAALKVTAQFDTVALAETALPPGPRAAQGGGFRRLRIGVAGRLSDTVSYEFTPKFEAVTSLRYIPIANAFVQYDGVAPLHFKIGAFAAPANLDDSTASADLMFLERAQPAELARGLVASSGRTAATVFAYDTDWFASLSYTGGLLSDAPLRQKALVARAAWRPWQDGDSGLAIGADVTHVFSPPQIGAAHLLRLRQRPEINEQPVDLRLVDTGLIDSDSLTETGLEMAGNLGSVYGQSGAFRFTLDRATPGLPAPVFGGWYLQASWFLTGENRSWRAARGSYGAPSPAHPLTGDGWGAFEVAARYSELDLDDRIGAFGTAAAPDAVRGGRQRIETVALNWYPGGVLRFMLDYQHVQATRLDPAGHSLDGRMDLVALRSQIAF